MQENIERPTAVAEFTYVPEVGRREELGRLDNGLESIDADDLTTSPRPKLDAGRFLRSEAVEIEALNYHGLHPRGHEIWPKARLLQMTAAFQAHGQVKPIIAVQLTSADDTLLVIIDHGYLKIARDLREFELRVDVWHLSDRQIVDRIIQDETYSRPLSGFERAVTFQAFVDANGGVQRECWNELGFESESGLSRVLSIQRLPPVILDCLADKTKIGVGVAAKVVSVCRNNEVALSLAEAWARANMATALEKSPGTVLKELLRVLDPPPLEPELKPIENGRWQFVTPAETVLAVVTKIGGTKFTAQIDDAATLSTKNFRLLQQQIAGLSA